MPEKKAASPAPTTLSSSVVSWLVAMCVAATLLVLTNKHILRQYDCPFALTGIQNAVTVVINLAAARCGVLRMEPWRLSEIKQFLVQGTLLAATLGLSNYGLPRVATSTLIVPKSLTAVFCLWAESSLQLAQFSRTAHYALLISFAGSVMYATQDLHYEAPGYSAFVAVSLLNCVLTVYERRINLSVQQTPVGCSCYKNLISLPLFLAFSVLAQEPQKLPPLQELPVTLWVGILLSTVLGFGLSLCYATLAKTTAATTVVAASNMNKLLTSLVGSHIFKERTTRGAGAGLFFSLGGIVLYGIDKSGGSILQPGWMLLLGVLGAGAGLLTAL